MAGALGRSTLSNMAIFSNHQNSEYPLASVLFHQILFCNMEHFHRHDAKVYSTVPSDILLVFLCSTIEIPEESYKSPKILSHIENEGDSTV